MKHSHKNRFIPSFIPLLMLGFIGLVAYVALPANASNGNLVYLIEVHGAIDLGLVPYVRRTLEEAHEAQASWAILDIDTPGGRLDAALDIKDSLLSAKVPTIAFINRQAYSAGALIAIASEEIYMAPAAVFGAATPVIGETGEQASEKVVSAVRKAFKSTAEARGHDPIVAEAMVDEDVEIPDLIQKGKLLTLTTKEAMELGYIQGVVVNHQALLELLELDRAVVVRTTPGFAEQLVRFLTNPVLASILMSVGVLGLVYEFQSPGFGLGGLVAAIMLGVFFWGHSLAGLAGWEGVILVILGVILIALELLVTTGFGLLGFVGIVALLGGLFISLVGNMPTVGDYLRALYMVVSSLVLVIIGAYVSVRYLPRRSAGGLVLQATLTKVWRVPHRNRRGLNDVALDSRGHKRRPQGSLVGKRGEAHTDLRPAGVAMIDGQRVDVITAGDFVPSGTIIEVVIDEDYRRVVQPVSGRSGGTITSIEL